jgi:hypothetical protein
MFPLEDLCKGQETTTGTLLKTSSRFSLPLTILIQIRQITALAYRVTCYFKFASVKLVYDINFTLETYVSQQGFNVSHDFLKSFTFQIIGLNESIVTSNKLGNNFAGLGISVLGPNVSRGSPVFPGVLSPGVKRGRGVMVTTHPKVVNE